ncbi:MAG: type 4a pilus biogenesis protein PilO [Pseudomonadota bacterium]
MNLEELQSLDFEDPGGWPIAAKAIAAGAVALAVLGVSYFLQIKDQLASLDQKRAQQVQLFQEFREKHQKSAKLEEYREQLEDMEEILRSLLRQLPSRTEMANLLQDISQTAIATGIDIRTFRPLAEIGKDFYAEQPITVQMRGGYHQFGGLVSQVASLSRVVILTMHDITLKPESVGSETLVLEGTLKTYRYVDEDEQIIGGTP